MTKFLFHRCALSGLLLLSLSCAGCLVPLPVVTPLPPGMAITPVAEHLQAQSPVAVTLDGSLLAFVRRDGLFIRPLVAGIEQKLSGEIPVALVFNREGRELVAAFVAGDMSRLRRYSTGTGALIAEVSFSGRCEALLSREGEWLAFVTTLQTFRFGGNLRSRLLRWDGVQITSESLLNDMTLDRSTLVDTGALLSTLRPQLSPHGDEILYLRLHDPPAFDPYFAVVLRHLDTGSDRLVVKLPLTRGAAVYVDGGEHIAYGDGINLVNIVDPWQEREIARYPRPGALLAAPLAGEFLWADDSLLRRDGQLFMDFARGLQPVTFLADGRLLLRDKGRLWLLTGLPAPPKAPVLDDSEPLRLLRKWRAEKLIDVREYEERIRK